MEADLVVCHRLECPHRVLFAYALLRLKGQGQITLQQPDLTRAAQREQHRSLLGGHVRVLVARPQEFPVGIVAMSYRGAVNRLTQVNWHRILFIRLRFVAPGAIVGLRHRHTVGHLILARPVADHGLEQHLILALNLAEGVIQPIHVQVNGLY